MQSKITATMHKLSSRRAAKRKRAIRELLGFLAHREGYLARLSLQYVAEHDPCYTVRNIARQAFYRVGSPPPAAAGWEKTHAF